MCECVTGSFGGSYLKKSKFHPGENLVFYITILKVNEVNALANGGHTQPDLTLSLNKTNHENIQWRPTGIHKKPK